MDLVVCGVHFDESRMFDLLRVAMADPELRDLSFVCFRDLDSELGPVLLQSLGIACVALGAREFVDIYELKRRVGSRRADEAFRRILLRYVAVAEP